MDINYNDLLDRAIFKLPNEKVLNERFTVPDIKLYSEGKTTIIDNFLLISDVLRRDKDHLMKYLTRELGTAGKIEGQKALFQGHFTKEQISINIKSYINEYVICSECNRPDTTLEKIDRILILKCAACGAHRPVKKRQTTKSIFSVEEGNTYSVFIESVGSKGDGIAKIDRYTIFVPGAQSGKNINIKIKKIMGNLAFGEIIK